MSKEKEVAVWDYLVKQVGHIDNNLTARKIYNYLKRKGLFYKMVDAGKKYSFRTTLA